MQAKFVARQQVVLQRPEPPFAEGEVVTIAQVVPTPQAVSYLITDGQGRKTWVLERSLAALPPRGRRLRG